MYVTSSENLGHSSTSRTIGVAGLRGSVAKSAAITPELLNQLTDLVLYARNPSLKGRSIRRGERELQREWTSIRARLVSPPIGGSTGRFAVYLTPPKTNPHPDFSKTEDQLGAWESASFASTIQFAFATEETTTRGRLGSYVSTLSVAFDNPRFTVNIAKHLRDNAQDQTRTNQDRSNWLRTCGLVLTHTYEHLKIYRRTAQTMEKVLREVMNRLLPLPTLERPLAVSKGELDDYLYGVGEFLHAVVVRECWEKTCDWEKQDYPKLTRSIRLAGAMSLITALTVNCGPKPSVPNVPLPPVPVTEK
jgi:hypothetical protein